MMNNWVVKLLLALGVPALAGVGFTYFLQPDMSGWLVIVSYAVAPLLSIGTVLFFRVRRQGLLAALMAVASIAFNVPLQNWLFHSADDVVRYASVHDLYEAKEKPVYFAFDRLEVDGARSSSVVVQRDQNRRVSRRVYRREKKSFTFTVSPAFEDSLPAMKYAEREVKAWVASVKHPSGVSPICYEWCVFDLDDYRKAIAKSRCKVCHPDAPLIRPLYKPFITKRKWKAIFLHTGCAVLSVLILTGVIINYKEMKK